MIIIIFYREKPSNTRVNVSNSFKRYWPILIWFFSYWNYYIINSFSMIMWFWCNEGFTEFSHISLWQSYNIAHRVTTLSSSSSCHATSTDFSDPLLPSVSIVSRSRQVLQATSVIGTELWYVGSSWSSNLCSSMCKGSQEYIANEYVLTSPAVCHMSVSSNLNSSRDGCTATVLWDVASKIYSTQLAAF